MSEPKRDWRGEIYQIMVRQYGLSSDEARRRLQAEEAKWAFTLGAREMFATPAPRTEEVGE